MKIAIITGDLVNSRTVESKIWLPKLKQTLRFFGAEPGQWEVYRGDSFQLEVPAVRAIAAMIYMKAAIKQISNLDVRMAVGLGEKSFNASKISESNGNAFVRSGDGFEQLKKNTLHINSGNEALDEELNLYLKLASLTIDRWQPSACRVIQTVLENPTKTQKEIAALLGKSQSTISESLLRSGFEEVMEMEKRCKKVIQSL